MISPPIVIEAATELPVSLAEARAISRIDHQEDDVVLTQNIRAAFSFLQPPSGWLGRSVLRQTLEQRLPCFPSSASPWRLLAGPVSSIVQVTYFDGNNTGQTLGPTNYFLEQDAIMWASGISFPSTYDRPGAVRIRYQAGYASAAQIPEPIRLAILQMTAQWYENRQAVATVGPGAMMPAQALDLLHPYRIW